MLPMKSRRKPPPLQIPTTTKVLPRQWRRSYLVRRWWQARHEWGRRAHRGIVGSAGTGPPRGGVDDASDACGARFFPCVALGWLHTEGALRPFSFGRIQRPFPLAAGVLVLGRRALRPLRPP